MERDFMGLNSPILIKEESDVSGNNSKAQLTMFYGGTVNVFDDITPEKAEAIILLAAGNGCGTSTVPQATAFQFPSAVPQSRKASLARFLVKRKERATSVAPYKQC